MFAAHAPIDVSHSFDSPKESADDYLGDPVQRSVTLVTDIAFWERSIGSHTRIRSLSRHLAAHHKLTVFYLKPLSDSAREGFERLNLPGAQIVSHLDH